MSCTPGMNYMALLPPETHASSGCGLVATEEVCEAIGAYLLTNTGYKVEGAATKLDKFRHEATSEFTYKGRVWRVTIVYVYDINLKQEVPFRMDFDYIKEETKNDQREEAVDGPRAVQRRSFRAEQCDQWDRERIGEWICE